MDHPLSSLGDFNPKPLTKIPSNTIVFVVGGGGVVFFFLSRNHETRGKISKEAPFIKCF